ncbi:MAG: class I SAM-dependent methyltransferase [Anaerolineae bacterium]
MAVNLSKGQAAHVKAIWTSYPRYLFRKTLVLGEIQRLPQIGSFLDVGCGTGDLACNVARLTKAKGVGIDFSDEAITIAERLRAAYGIAEEDLVFRKAHLSKQSDQADLVLCLEVIEHVKDDTAFFSDLVSATRNFLILSVPARQAWFGSSDRVAGHYRRYEREDLKKMCLAHNMQIRSFRSFGFPFLHLMRWMRDRQANGYVQKDRTPEERSRRSSMNPFSAKRWLLDVVGFLVPLFVLLSRPFERGDWGEGYLLVAQKRA